MKKIGIITLNGNINYGNRLQNYALEKAIKKLELEVNTIWICSHKEYAKEKMKKIVFLFTNKRKYKFIKFSDKYINTKYYFSNNIDSKYNYFIAGSDQVWNYNFPNFDSNMLLSFANDRKKISYAASFGIDNIIDEKKEIFKGELSKYKYISVREETGKKIVEDITGRKDVEVLVDPTMLLTAEEWDKVSKKPEQLKKDKYILNYFLGKLSEKRKKEIDKIAEENECEVINILDKNSPFYQTGPSEFLYLEKNAFLICTDSFHSCVFSILYNRPFIVFEREDNSVSMNSRIETLLNKFQLQDRKYNNKEILSEQLKCDYTNAYKILEKEKERANEFLIKSLDVKRG